MKPFLGISENLSYTHAFTLETVQPILLNDSAHINQQYGNTLLVSVMLSNF
jgi:hypothetical protein